MADQFKIRGIYAQLTGGNYDEQGRMTDVSALAFACIKVLAVEQPADFHIERMDPIVDEKLDDRLVEVYIALTEKERSFRPGSAAAVEGAGAGAGEDVRAVVPPNVSAGAD
ncbi:hypothetical protein D7S86_26990 [Pararobbsia silviterrae]|uniref:Uncharacterized protein n=2 Tax=Pararobbsia silviterrae TaxID=1792498 RepID=A0A494X9A9_9BURK|nr:hypothetical protein D7S86_26990 [Pararobbsia silviterrae]